MKKIVMFSLVLNVGVAIFYSTFYASSTRQDISDIVGETMLQTGDLFDVEVERARVPLKNMLEKKPMLIAPMSNVFKCSDESINDFLREITLLKKQSNISTKDILNICQLNDKIHLDFLNYYTELVSSKAVMKEGKLTSMEVEERIKGFENSIVNIAPKLEDKNLCFLPDYLKRDLLNQIELSAKYSHSIVNSKIGELVGGRSTGCRRYFPVIFSEDYAIQHGEKFKAKLAVGAYGSSESKRAAIYHNNQKLHPKDGVSKVKIKVDKLRKNREVFHYVYSYPYRKRKTNLFRRFIIYTSTIRFYRSKI